MPEFSGRASFLVMTGDSQAQQQRGRQRPTLPGRSVEAVEDGPDGAIGAEITNHDVVGALQTQPGVRIIWNARAVLVLATVDAIDVGQTGAISEANIVGASGGGHPIEDHPAIRRQRFAHHQSSLGPGVYGVQRLDSYSHVEIGGDRIIGVEELIGSIPNVRTSADHHVRAGCISGEDARRQRTINIREASKLAARR